MMETLVLLANDCHQDAWLRGSAPVMFALRADDYGYCSHIGQTCSGLSEHMHTIKYSCMPRDILTWRPHGITKQHVFFPASVVELETSQYNSIKYHTAPVQRFKTTPSQSSRQFFGNGHCRKQGCSSGQAVCGWMFAKARHHRRSQQQAGCEYSASRLVARKSLEEVSPVRKELPVCRTPPMARASSLEPFKIESSHTYISKASKLLTGRCGKEYPASTTQESSSLTSVLLDVIKGVEGTECSSIVESKENTAPCHFSPSLKEGIDKHDRGGLKPFDPIVTTCTPLAMKGYTAEVSQSAQSPCMEERWAGPAFSNSPPPSALPVPSFARRRLRTSSFEIPGAASESLPDLTCGSASGTPSRSFSLPSIGAFPANLDTIDATQSLKRLLNLDVRP